MKSKTLLAAAFLGTTTLFLAQSATVHDMWLNKTDTGYDMAYGHPGKTDPYPPEKKALYVKGYTENSWEVPVKMINEKDYARIHVTDDFYLLTGGFDNLYWLNTEDGWKNFDEPVTREGVTEAGHAIKMTKHIVKWAPYMTKPIGQRAEIVPLKDPTGLKEGDVLPIMIYLEGKPIPAAGTRVALSSDFTVEHPEMVYLESEGPVMIKVGPPGTQLISVKHEHPLDEIHNLWYAFSLTFTTTK